MRIYEIHGNVGDVIVWKKERGYILYSGVCIQLLWIYIYLLCPYLYFECLDLLVYFLCDFVWFPDPSKKERAGKKHEFWQYSDLQIFYQDPIGDQNHGWSEPAKCQSY